MADMAEVRFPQKGRKLFDMKFDSYYSMGYVGWGDIDTQFWGYINGYKNAADELVNLAIQSKDIAILDTYVFPIIFLYRQFVELAIKSIYLSHSEDEPTTKAETLRWVGHNLHDAWIRIRPMLCHEADGSDQETVDAAEEYIEQFGI